MIKQEMLKKINIFKEIDEAIIKKIIPLCELKKISQGDILFKYKTRVSSLYMIIDGIIGLFIPLDHGRELKLHEAKQGETIGLSSVLPDDYLATFTARCIYSPTEIIELKSKELKKIFKKDKSMAYEITKSLLCTYNKKKVRQNMMFVRTLIAHPEIANILKK